MRGVGGVVGSWFVRRGSWLASLLLKEEQSCITPSPLLPFYEAKEADPLCWEFLRGHCSERINNMIPPPSRGRLGGGWGPRNTSH
jgi:hypothetical protein